MPSQFLRFPCRPSISRGAARRILGHRSRRSSFLFQFQRPALRPVRQETRQANSARAVAAADSSMNEESFSTHQARKPRKEPNATPGSPATSSLWHRAVMAILRVRIIDRTCKLSGQRGESCKLPYRVSPQNGPDGLEFEGPVSMPCPKKSNSWRVKN